MKTGRVIGWVFSLALVAFALWFDSRRLMPGKELFRAQSSFVLCDSSVTTNVTGGIVRSQCRNEAGTYQDLGLVVSDGLDPLLRGGSRAEAILRSYMQSKCRVDAPGFSITNAFDSAEYRKDEGLVGGVQLFVTAESRELALDVSRYIMSNYVKSVEAANLSAEGKALAKLKWDIQKKREAHGDVSDLLRELERAKGVVKSYRKKVIVISMPHVVE